MNKHTKVLISIEGKNIDSSVLDTNDISVQRGGSYELLDTALAAGEKLAEKAGIETVSIGASKAVFVAIIENAADALKVLSSIVERDDKKMFSNFVTSIPFTNDTDFGLAEKKSVAVSGWRQLQRSTVPIPQIKTVGDKSVFSVCSLDRVHPAIHFKTLDKQKVGTSDFVELRRKRGRNLRDTLNPSGRLGDIYSRIFDAAGVSHLATKKFSNYTGDLGELAIFDETEKAAIDFRMHSKIAVLFADGNGFGEIAAGAAGRSAQDLSIWDQKVRKLRAQLLKDVLEQVQENPNMFFNEATDKNEAAQLLRFETLEWGGDELMWVVPAFMGFKLAQLFIDATAEWKEPFATNGEYRHLHHAIGLVFCHHKAPIARVRKLARNLSDLAKRQKSAEERTSHRLADHRFENSTRLVWTALESFDHLGLELETGLAARFNNKLEAADWVMTSREVMLLSEIFSNDKKQLLPRTQIISAAFRCVHSNCPDANKVLVHAYRECFTEVEPWAIKFRKQFEELSGKAIPDLRTIEADKLCKQERRAWILLAEAFDYLGHIA
jgi:hypothetical protein